jgi:hypothetical protein
MQPGSSNLLSYRQKKPPSAEGKGRKDVQTLDSSELFTLRGGIYETSGDKLLNLVFTAMPNNDSAKKRLKQNM